MTVNEGDDPESAQDNYLRNLIALTTFPELPYGSHGLNHVTHTPSKNITLQKLQFNYLILGLIEEVCSTSKFNFVDLSVLLF